MDFSKLVVLIERNRVLNEMSSLPFIVESNGVNKLAWFYFIVEPTEEDITGKINKIFIIDKNMLVDKKAVCLKVKILEVDNCEPEISEKEYIEKLSTDYELINYINNFCRIKKTVLNSFIPLYESVFQWVMSKETMKSTLK